MNAQKNSGAGAGGAGRGMGFSMDADRGGSGGGGGRGQRPGGPGGPGGPGRGRDGGKGGKGGRDGGKGRGRDDREGGGAGSAGYRVSSELGNLEKALTKSDYANQKQPLEEILKSLRPLKLTSIEQLDLNTRGKLITSLLRVTRQPKPAESAPAEAAPAEAAAAEAPAADAAPAAEAPAAEAPAAEAPAAEAAPAAETAAPAEGAEAAPAEAAPAEAAAPAEPAKPLADPKITAWQDVQYLVGSIWRAVREDDRAAVAFTNSGREFKERAEEPRSAPAAHKEGTGRSSAGKPELGPVEKAKRTRDSARVQERNGKFAEAAKLYEEAGDLKSALANAVFAKLEDVVDRLMGVMKQPEWQPVLEKAGEWERLMGIYVKRADFDSVAKLYERAKQFDQAGLAWERAGKLSVARKLYERAKDTSSANRVRELEVKKLIERGDRLGAATIQLAAGQKEAAVETVKGLPGPKAFRFLQKLKLDAEAKAYAAEEIAKAVTDNKPGDQARWLELTGETAGAAEAWIKAERKDKALPLYEQLSDWPRAAALAETLGQQDKAVELFTKAGDKANADRVAAMPKPVPAVVPPEAAASDAAAAAENAPGAPPAAEPEAPAPRPSA